MDFHPIKDGEDSIVLLVGLMFIISLILIVSAIPYFYKYAWKNHIWIVTCNEESKIIKMPTASLQHPLFAHCSFKELNNSNESISLLTGLKWRKQTG